MDYKDYYKTLGVPRTASAAEIKKAFRVLARKHHPDVKPGDDLSEQLFKDVNEAYEVLGDPEKRKRYDALGADWERYAHAEWPAGDPFSAFGGTAGGRTGPGGIRYEYRTSGEASGFSDFFRMFFDGSAAPAGGSGPGGAGGGRGRRSIDELFGGYETTGRRTSQRTAPRPVEVAVDVSLEEAFHGTSRLIEVDGKRLEVQVPRGVDDGSRIRLSGKGGGDGAAARDLYLVTRVLPHSTFTRKGADLTRELTLDLRTALLGGEVRVPTLAGAVLLTIPAGTQPGRTFRLAGQGMPRLRAEGRGALLVRVGIRIPTLQDDAARQAATAFFDTLAGADDGATAGTAAGTGNGTAHGAS